MGKPNMEKSVIYWGLLKKSGLSTSEYVIMDFISNMVGDRKDSFSTLRQVPISQIADWVNLSATHVTRIVEGLVKKKFLERGIEYNSKRLLPTKKWYRLCREKENV